MPNQRVTLPPTSVMGRRNSLMWLAVFDLLSEYVRSQEQAEALTVEVFALIAGDWRDPPQS